MERYFYQCVRIWVAAETFGCVSLWLFLAPIWQNTEQNTLRPILDGVQQSWWTDIAYLVSTYELDGNVKTYWGIYDVEIGWVLS